MVTASAKTVDWCNSIPDHDATGAVVQSADALAVCSRDTSDSFSATVVHISLRQLSLFLVFCDEIGQSIDCDDCILSADLSV